MQTFINKPNFKYKMALAEVLKDQLQELKKGLQEIALIPREAEKTLNPSSKLIQVVSGVRRCGKSVLVYKLLTEKKFAYVNFDDDRLIDIEPNDILSGIYQVYGEDCKTLFLDEIQNLEKWELFVNRLHRTGFKLFITGSNSKLLAKEMATHLTGRHLTLELFPFSFKEYLSAKKVEQDQGTTKGRSIIQKHMKEYIKDGGFPEIVINGEESQIYLRELYTKIIERDIVSRYNIAYKKTIKEIAGSIISNPSRLVSIGKIRRQFGLGSDHTVKNYLSYLEEAYLIFFVNKFSFKPIEIEKSEKKVYIIDTGLSTAISLQHNADYGRMYENIVALELLRNRKEIYYWKNPQQEEVDFVIRESRKIMQLIQVCYNPSDSITEQREVRSLLKASQALHCKNLTLITEEKDQEKTIEWFGIKRKVKYVPLWKWLLRI